MKQVYPFHYIQSLKRALRIQTAFRRYRFKKYRSRLYQRCMRQSSSQQQLILPKLAIHQKQNSQQHALERSQSSYFSCRGLFEDKQTPTKSERKKSVSFSDPLEEVYIVESFKSQRPRSADKYRRRNRYERNFITSIVNQQLQRKQKDDFMVSHSGENHGSKIEIQNSALSMLEIKYSPCNNNPIKPYYSNSSNKNNNNSNPQDISDQPIIQPSPKRKTSQRLFMLLGNDSILVPDLPTINEFQRFSKSLEQIAKKVSQQYNTNQVEYSKDTQQLEQLIELQLKILVEYNSIIDKVAITSQKVTRNDKEFQQKDRIYYPVSKTTKAPMKNITMLSKSPRSKPIPVYQSSNSNNTSITTQSKSPNIKKGESSLNSTLNKSDKKPQKINNLKSSNSIAKGSFIKLLKINESDSNRNENSSKLESLNTSNSFARLHNQSIKNIRNKEQSQKVNKKEVLDPNFFKRYLEVQSLLTSSNQFTTKTSKIQPTDNQHHAQQKITSSFIIDKEKLHDIQQSTESILVDQRPKSRNQLMPANATQTFGKQFELNTQFQNTALKSFNNITPRKTLDFLSSLEINNKLSHSFINEQKSTLKLNSRKNFVSPNSSVLMNRHQDALKKLQKKQQDFSFNQSASIALEEENRDKMNDISVVDITPDKNNSFINSTNQQQQKRNLQTIRSRLQLNSCKSTSLILNRSLNFDTSQ
ncbi:UNKNOWN [Stylonychia lemnae]|uniref:Uncharacterized protein n=1 Tax=Stylonychia lemnae TaxID=5949 RepID=A0A078A789_STYLE|nr:UNKNOWN [Stylonychia lemnae]|eukprot:CDW76661.1 UNKNOWN [Stylonychia lemnae]